MRSIKAWCLLPMLLWGINGCGDKVLLVAPGQPVMLGKPATVYPAVPDGKGGKVISSSAVQIPAGWYAVPPPTAKKVVSPATLPTR